MLVDHREHDAPLDLAELLRADLLLLRVVLVERVAVEQLEHGFRVGQFRDLVVRDANGEHVGGESHELVDVPVLGEFLAAGSGRHHMIDRALDRGDRLVA